MIPYLKSSRMSKQQQPDNLGQSRVEGYELQDANVRNVVVYGFGMLVLVVMLGFIFSIIVYKVMARNSNGYPPPSQFQAPQSELPPTPRLEEHPWSDLGEFREAETKQLDSYGWADKSKGIVKIPVERAMDLIVQRGLPERPSKVDSGDAGADTGGGKPERSPHNSGSKPSAPSGSPGK
jgi:hypothetical protein